MRLEYQKPLQDPKRKQAGFWAALGSVLALTACTYGAVLILTAFVVLAGIIKACYVLSH